ncbi:MAG: acyltransferase [Acidovorax sp.]|nr:acyltransferase [Acidovorax sp.]
MAAFMVFCYHALPQYKAMGGASDVFARFAAVGFAGVDVFFVISGFVAALTTLDKERTAANAMQFLKRRVLRIYLGYWPFFGLALLVFWQSGFALGSLDLLGSFFLASVDMPRLLLYVSWSLTYELIFYGLVAATFAFPARSVAVLAHRCLFAAGWCIALQVGRASFTHFHFSGLPGGVSGWRVAVHPPRCASQGVGGLWQVLWRSFWRTGAERRGWPRTGTIRIVHFRCRGSFSRDAGDSAGAVPNLDCTAICSGSWRRFVHAVPAASGVARDFCWPCARCAGSEPLSARSRVLRVPCRRCGAEPAALPAPGIAALSLEYRRCAARKGLKKRSQTL